MKYASQRIQRLTRLDSSGFDHILVPLCCFVVFALIGSFYLYHSLAATSVQWKGVLEAAKTNSGYCLTTTGSAKASLIELDPCAKTYDSKQVWSLVDIRKATVSSETNVQEFYLQSADGGDCIDNWGASKKTAYPEKLYPCSTSDSAVTWIWGVKFASRGYSSHQLANMAASSLCLDDRNGSDKSGTYVGLYTCKTTAQSNQEWMEQGAPGSTGSGSGGSSGSGSPTAVQGTTCPSPKPVAPVTGYTIAACQDFNSGLGDFSAYSGGGSGTVVGSGRETSQCTVSGGYLHLVQSSSGATCGGWMNNFGQQYGLWEVRMRAYFTSSSSGSSPHPVLILWPSNNDWTSELDFFETDLGSSATGYLHCTSSSGNASSNCYELPSNSVDYGQWHVYSFLWTSSKMTGYIDGKVWWSSSSTSSFQPLGSSNLTIQLDNLSGSTPVRPGEMDINWAHMFKAG